jgi:hypothetical protein
MFFHESRGALAITIMMMENLRRRTQQPQQGTLEYTFLNKNRKRTISESI